MPSKLPQVFAELTGKGERPARSHPYRTRKGRTVAIHPGTFTAGDNELLPPPERFTPP